MRGLAAMFAALAAASGGLAAPDDGELRRGVAAVADRTSAQPAMRTEAGGGPSAGFAAGAAVRAWSNAAAAVAFDAGHTTGDGGDAEALAVDCTDERLAFAELELRARTLGLPPAAIVEGAGLDGVLADRWRQRQKAKPAPCR